MMNDRDRLVLISIEQFDKLKQAHDSLRGQYGRSAGEHQKGIWATVGWKAAPHRGWRASWSMFRTRCSRQEIVLNAVGATTEIHCRAATCR